MRDWNKEAQERAIVALLSFFQLNQDMSAEQICDQVHAEIVSVSYLKKVGAYLSRHFTGFTIIIPSSVTDSVSRSFLLLHEIGHIALNPYGDYRRPFPNEEELCDRFAILMTIAPRMRGPLSTAMAREMLQPSIADENWDIWRGHVPHVIKRLVNVHGRSISKRQRSEIGILIKMLREDAPVLTPA